MRREKLEKDRMEQRERERQTDRQTDRERGVMTEILRREWERMN